MNPFLKFTVGGDFHVEIKRVGSQKKIYVPKGEKGVILFTDVTKYIE